MEWTNPKEHWKHHPALPVFSLKDPCRCCCNHQYHKRRISQRHLIFFRSPHAVWAKRTHRTLYYHPSRVGHFPVAMQCMGNSGCFPRGKRASIVRRYPAPPPPTHPHPHPHPCVQCFRVSMPQVMTPTLLRQMDIGFFTCTQIWMRTVQRNGVKKAQTSLLLRLCEHKLW